jgi:cytochrome c oxidase assembly protein subunit 15
MVNRILQSASSYSCWVHALAVALTVSVFPLIWVGGLVTTYDAGMAVPDWPGTYGWNMFAYPASTWLFGPFDLLVEHSHRLLGSLAGLLSIGLLIAAVKYDGRTWLRWWCLGILLAVIAQGVLGGARVVLDQRTFAMIHGCTGPLFFALATATAVMCSRWWICGRVETGSGVVAVKVEDGPAGIADTAGEATRPAIVWLATALTLASYLQLILGAQLRHATAAISHSQFLGFVHSHLTMAGLVVLLASLLTGFSLLAGKMASAIRRPVRLVCVLVFLQIALGIGTWIVNYALPWTEASQGLAAYTIVAKGYWESLIVTAHMATGSLIISLSTVASLCAWRTKPVGNGKS